MNDWKDGELEDRSVIGIWTNKIKWEKRVEKNWTQILCFKML